MRMLLPVLATLAAAAAPAGAHPEYDYSGECPRGGSAVFVARPAHDPALVAFVSITVRCYEFWTGFVYAEGSGTGVAVVSSGYVPPPGTPVCADVVVAADVHVRC